MTDTEVLVIGGGPAGLAAAIEAHRRGAKALLLEREARLGGILKQCVHDGFGLMRFGEKLTGPEYAGRFIREFRSLGIPCRTLSYVTHMERSGGGFAVTAVSREGLDTIRCRSLVLATGCRERTARQTAIHGTRPAGIFTAGTAQHLVNLMGQMPTKTCVVLGSGDIGLIMARRLTLEGARVEGVYEAKAEPSGLQRNLRQCLEDFGIPLHLRHTVTRVFGHERLTGVEVARVDEWMRPIPATERRVECDGLILSVGLIPENELAQALGAAMDERTRGPACDERLMTTVPGAFCCGNALHVSDLVDYVTESGVLAGGSAAAWQGEPDSPTVPLTAGEGLLYLVPARVHTGAKEAVCFFRADRERRDALFTVTVDGKRVLSKRYPALRPPEMQRLTLELTAWGLTENSRVELSVREGDRA